MHRTKVIKSPDIKDYLYKVLETVSEELKKETDKKQQAYLLGIYITTNAMINALTGGICGITLDCEFAYETWQFKQKNPKRITVDEIYAEVLSKLSSNSNSKNSKNSKKEY